MTNEQLLEQLESVANFMRGIQFDPRLPRDIKDALIDRATDLDDLVVANLKDN